MTFKQCDTCSWLPNLGKKLTSCSFGRPGVECYCQHESGAAVIQLQFLINEGALVSALADDTVHLWNLRQKRPAILHSLKFSRERAKEVTERLIPPPPPSSLSQSIITFCHLPFQSKWLYIGTERGNIHIVNVESFMLSGYVIMWNKAIELEDREERREVGGGTGVCRDQCMVHTQTSCLVSSTGLQGRKGESEWWERGAGESV
ncbi:hypothetical protein PAMP_014138 [Pampus punctatissimus]